MPLYRLAPHEFSPFTIWSGLSPLWWARFAGLPGCGGAEESALSGSGNPPARRRTRHLEVVGDGHSRRLALLKGASVNARDSGERRVVHAPNRSPRTKRSRSRLSTRDAWTDAVSAHPRRSVVLRALDGRPLSPVLRRFDVQPNDRYLLCSDGVSDVLGTDALRAALLADDPQECAFPVVLAEMRAGSTDNVSAVAGIRRLSRLRLQHPVAARCRRGRDGQASNSVVTTRAVARGASQRAAPRTYRPPRCRSSAPRQSA